ncbi:MAG: hypothetical protein IKL94_02530 [Clostridia bacterium]|nr:hypothetical protein [Clostridia bacterium]
MPYELGLEVMAHDINTHREASPSSIVKYLQEAVDRNLKECRPTYEELLEQNLSFIVSRTALKIYSPLKEYDKITVQTWATEGKSAAFMRNYRILCDGKTAAECVMTWALLDIKEHRLLRGSEFDVSSYGTGELLNLDMPSRFRINKDAVLTKCREKRVYYSDIDRNQHMNNVKYFDLLFDCIPNCENVRMTSCILNYVNEATYGKLIEIYSLPVEVLENGEKAYSFITKIDGETNVEARFTVTDI